MRRWAVVTTFDLHGPEPSDEAWEEAEQAVTAQLEDLYPMNVLVDHMPFGPGEIHLLTADGGIMTLEVLESRQAVGREAGRPSGLDPTVLMKVLGDVTMLLEAAFSLTTGRTPTRLEVTPGEIVDSDVGLMHMDMFRAYYMPKPPDRHVDTDGRLTCFELMEILDGVPGNTTVTVADDSWYKHVREVVVPGPDPQTAEFMSLTLFPGGEWDPREV